LLIGIFLSLLGFSQSCLPEGITFTTQAQINSFQTNYPNCTEIEGDIIINSIDINNLNGLNILVSIRGNLVIGNNGGGDANPLLYNLLGLENLFTIEGNVSINWNKTLSNLSGLNGLVSIGGNLEINHNDNLINLIGLDNLDTVGGNLIIDDDNSLISLFGLSKLTYVQGNVDICCHDNLASLSGLEGLKDIGGGLRICCNFALPNLSGLDSLETVGDKLQISNSPPLTSLMGLQGLTSIGGNLSIWDNDNLTDIIGLENVTSINGELYIVYNSDLNNLTGLENINAGSITNLNIYDNVSLSSCEAQSICEYLSSPNGIVNIYNNAIGCNNPPEIANSCQITLPCLPYANYYFYTQSDIDNFQINYPNCTQLRGNVTIQGSDISNLNGLSVINSIEGFLQITGNNSLINLSGFENLKTIVGSLTIQGNQSFNSLTGLEGLDSIGGNLTILNNPVLTDLTGLGNMYFLGGGVQISLNNSLSNLYGLEGIITINGTLEIGNNIMLTDLSGLHNVTFINGTISIINNSALTNLTGLNNVNSISGNISITNNDILTSLAGLDNIDADSITDLTIVDNPNLSICDAHSICDYLASPNGIVNIYNNGNNCNNPPEIANACEVTLPCLPYGTYNFFNQSDIDNFQINYPNCTHLAGNVFIQGSDISNLLGLNMTTSIQGGLEIDNTELLTSLEGLNNLNSIGNYFLIGNGEDKKNLSLTRLSELESLDSIGGYLVISYNPKLAGLSGLQSIKSLGGGLIIGHNDILTNLSGLNNLNSIGNYFSIGNGEDKNNLSPKWIKGLETLDSIGGNLVIIYNPKLADVSGLESVKSLGGVLSIKNNDVLTNLTGLNNLTTIGNMISIENNNALTSLSGLDKVNSINGDLWIRNNNALISLSGLDNINADSITNLYIYFNSSLSNCEMESICEYLANPNGNFNIHDNATGCNNPIEVESACEIISCLPEGITFTSLKQIDSFQTNYPDCHVIKGDVTIIGTDITNLNGLSSLIAIRGSLSIRDNPMLTSMIGLENIIAGSITGLHIYNNNLLSTCEVQSVCDYLSIPNGMIEIRDNATGCNSLEEVHLACTFGLEERNPLENQFNIYPNPSSTSITIKLSTNKLANNSNLTIYNVNSQEVISSRMTEPKTIVDISKLPFGVYFVQLTNNSSVQMAKFVKQ